MAQLDTLAQLLGLNQEAEAQALDKPGLSPFVMGLMNPQPAPITLAGPAQALRAKLDSKAKASKPVTKKSTGPVAAQAEPMPAKPLTMEERFQQQANKEAGRVGQVDTSIEANMKRDERYNKAIDSEEWKKRIDLLRIATGYDPETGQRRENTGLPTYKYMLNNIVNMLNTSGDIRRKADAMEANPWPQADINPVLQLLEQNTKIKSPKVNPQYGPMDILKMREKQGDLEAATGALREKLLSEEMVLLKGTGYNAGGSQIFIGTDQKPTPLPKTSGGTGPKINPNNYAKWAAGMGEPTLNYNSAKSLRDELTAMRSQGKKIPGINFIKNIAGPLFQTGEEQRIWQTLQSGVNAATYAKSGKVVTGNEMERLKKEYGIYPGQDEDSFMRGVNKLINDFESGVAMHRALLPDPNERAPYNQAAGVDLEGIARGAAITKQGAAKKPSIQEMREALKNRRTP